MFGDHAGSWNLRDRHMADTLDQLLAHLDRHGGTARVVVWAHNSHVGDARATEMGARGELNIGQLMRERHGRDVVNVGFTTYTGHRHRRLATGAARPSASACGPRLPDSYEALLHATRHPRLPAVPARRRRERPRAARAAPGARDRRHLPARDRAPEPLVRRERRPSVRRARPHRPHARGRAARAHPELGAGRAPRDLPDRALNQGTTRRGPASPPKRSRSPPSAEGVPGCARCDRDRLLGRLLGERDRHLDDAVARGVVSCAPPAVQRRPEGESVCSGASDRCEEQAVRRGRSRRPVEVEFVVLA